MIINTSFYFILFYFAFTQMTPFLAIVVVHRAQGADREKDIANVLLVAIARIIEMENYNEAQKWNENDGFYMVLL